MSATLTAALLAGLCMLLGIGGVLLWRRIVQPRRRRSAAVLFTEVQLQLLTQAAMAALLDEARRSLLHVDRPAP